MGERGSTEDVENREELVLWYIGPDGRKERSDLLQQLLVIGNWWVQNSTVVGFQPPGMLRSDPHHSPTQRVMYGSSLTYLCPRTPIEAAPGWSSIEGSYGVTSCWSFSPQTSLWNSCKKYSISKGWDMTRWVGTANSTQILGRRIALDRITYCLTWCLAITNRAANWYFEF